MRFTGSVVSGIVLLILGIPCYWLIFWVLKPIFLFISGYYSVDFRVLLFYLGNLEETMK